MKPLADVHERNARLFPYNPAIVYGASVCNFRDFSMRINKLADSLHGLGVRRQDQVAVLSMNRPEYVERYGGCERVGFIMTTINFRLASLELAYVL